MERCRFLFSKGEPNPTPWTNYPPATAAATFDQQATDQATENPSGLWGWISNNKMLATVVGKAKVSDDSWAKPRTSATGAFSHRLDWH